MDKAKISPYDLGFLRGYGVFDVMRTQNRKLFLPDEHWNGLRNSAKKLGLKIPIGKTGYRRAVGKLLLLNKFKESAVRTVLTGGLSGNGFLYESGRETFLILVEKFKPLPDEIFRKGAGAAVVDYDREFPQAKVTNYAAAIRNQESKIKDRALEIIYVKNGKATEASTSNFFIVKNGKLITAKDGVLLGTTRNLVINLAKKAGYATEERDISEKELYSADEMFLTATLKTIVPIVKVGGKKVGHAKVGKITQELLKIFAKFSDEY